MKYSEIVYSSNGTTAQMHESIRAVEEFVVRVSEIDKSLAEEFLKEQYIIMNGKHFTPELAKRIVANMWHTDSNGKRCVGEHWGIDEVRQVLSNSDAPMTSKTGWDEYIALNANYHDKDILFKRWFGSDSEKKIIEDAINFWLEDEDRDEKIWDYFEPSLV